MSDWTQERYVLKLEAEITRLKAVINQYEGELRIKSDFISSRQCPDHNGKWQRGACLQCEIERQAITIERLETEVDQLDAENERVHDELHAAKAEIERKESSDASFS